MKELRKNYEKYYLNTTEGVTNERYVDLPKTPNLQNLLKVFQLFAPVCTINELMQGHSEGGSWGARDPPFVSLF